MGVVATLPEFSEWTLHTYIVDMKSISKADKLYRHANIS